LEAKLSTIPAWDVRITREKLQVRNGRKNMSCRVLWCGGIAHTRIHACPACPPTGEDKRAWVAY
jgi:hypothetical protein